MFYVDWSDAYGRLTKGSKWIDHVAFTTDKPVYQVGDKATVTIPKSTEGRVLVSIENGTRIIQREWIKTSEKKTQYTFTITDEMN